MQGDIIAILSYGGGLVAEYEYDSWGNCTNLFDTNDIADINPLRYRGYYYDTDTGLYYLQSRYYDSNIGRFINADEAEFLGMNGGVVSNNLFAYCNNNPVNNVDPTGHVSLGAIIGGFIGLGAGAIFVPMLADKWGLKGWKRKIFIGLGVAATTALGSLLGHYAGKAIAALYAKGGTFAYTLNKAIAKTIAKFTRASLKAASGNGWVLNLGKYTVRIMTSSAGRSNYFRLSMAGKGAMTILGTFSNNRALTHINITVGNIVKLIALMLKWKR